MVASIFLLCGFNGILAADSLPLEMEFATVHGDFTPEMVDRLEFQAYEADTPLQTGTGESGVVLKLLIPPKTVLETSKNLILQPHYLWHVTGWFKYRDRQQWTHTVVGRLLPPTATYYSTKDLVFEIERTLEKGTPIYLHIRDNRSPKPVRVRLFERGEYLIEDVAFSRLISTIYGMTFVMAVANLLFFYFIREKSFLLYSIYMLLALNGMMWQEGWIGRLFTLEATVGADRALRICAVIPMVAYYWFFRSYLGLTAKQWSGRFLIAIQTAIGGLLVASLVESLALGTYARPVWIGLSNGVLAVGAIGVFIVTLRAWIEGNRLALYLFAANLVLVTATLMRIFDAFTFGADSYWLNHSFEIALAIDAVLLSLAVANRTLKIRRERDEVKVDLDRIDNAYKREQMLAEFVRDSKSLATDHLSLDFSEKLDSLMYQCIKRLVDAREVVLLTKDRKELTYRRIGEEKILERFPTTKAAFDLSQILENCCRKKATSGLLPDHPKLQERYAYLLIPVRFRERMDYCVMLLIPQTQSLDKESEYGLREFVEKAVYARIDAENMSRLQHSAKHDDLTGVFNRASMEIHVSGLLERCAEAGPGLSLAFVDIDHFKLLNDSMGHDFGDDCLQLLCRTLQEILPVDAAVGRFGGDEFLVVLPGSDYFQTTELLARLNPSFQRQMVDRAITLSVSIGIAECPSGQSIPLGHLMKKADLSLYAAKAAGRGCIGAKVDTSEYS